MIPKIELLAMGRPFASSEDFSCKPFFKKLQKILYIPITLEEVEVGDIVLCKHKSNPQYRKVIEISKSRGLHVEDNEGNEDGWTKKVYGKILVQKMLNSQVGDKHLHSDAKSEYGESP